MLGLVAKKEKYFYTAKWVSRKDHTKNGYFRFAIKTDDNLYRQTLSNMSGATGNAVWETKSGLPFDVLDSLYFRGQRFTISNIDGNRKAEEDKEQAFNYVTNNGNIPITLQVRRAE